MATLREEIDIIAFNLGQTENYEAKEAIKFSILVYLAKLFREDYSKTGMYRNSFLVTLKCLALEEVSSTDCCSVDLGCNILRTVLTIPKPLDIKDGFDFEYVGSISMKGGKTFGYVKPSEAQFIQHRKFSRNETFYSYFDDRIYIFNNLALDKLKTRYLPANPLELNGMNCDSICFDLETDYIVPADLMAIVRTLVYQEFNQSRDKQQEIQVNDGNKQ